jgi:hypothetical protein
MNNEKGEKKENAIAFVSPFSLSLPFLCLSFFFVSPFSLAIAFVSPFSLAIAFVSFFFVSPFSLAIAFVSPYLCLSFFFKKKERQR